MSSTALEAPTRAVPTIGDHSCDRACHDRPVPLASDSLATLNPDMPTKRARQPALQARLQRENTHDEIYEKIYVAVLEHRLHPGTKLVEERLAEIFDVSRARIREVLARLAHEQIVELYPQRGAYVAKPTIEQALDVFEARRLIEPAVVRRLIETLTPEKLARLSSRRRASTSSSWCWRSRATRSGVSVSIRRRSSAGSIRRRASNTSIACSGVGRAT